jgi:hypothetical protein
MYTITTNYIKYLTNVEAILVKANAWKEEKKISDETLCNARLILDQFPLATQIQVMTDAAKKSAAVIAGVEAPVYEDNEKTMAELIARVQKTRVFLESLPKDVVAPALDTTVIPFKWAPGKGYTAKYYVEFYAMSNFYFHMVTAYSILRHYGLSIGKMDFMGNLELTDLA